MNSKLTENLDKLTNKLKIDQHKGSTFNRFKNKNQLFNKDAGSVSSKTGFRNRCQHINCKTSKLDAYCFKMKSHLTTI